MGQGGETLGGIELFKNLPAADLTALAGRCQWGRYTTDLSDIRSSFAFPQSFFLVLSGGTAAIPQIPLQESNTPVGMSSTDLQRKDNKTKPKIKARITAQTA